MEKKILKSFFIVGLAVRTSNENGQAATDIPALWDRFNTENISAQITGKLSEEVYSVYTEYEGDYTKPYTTIIGCRVENLDHISEEMDGIQIDGGEFVKFIAKGNLHEGVVYNAWVDIWNSDLPRAYTADFEIYGEKAMNLEDAEVEIFLSVR